MNCFQLKEHCPTTQALQDYLGWTGKEDIDVIAVTIVLCDRIKALERKLEALSAVVLDPSNHVENRDR